MVDVFKAANEVGKLTALKFFPTDKAGREGILMLLCGMATNNDQVEWVVEQMLAWYNEWPGPREMRGVFCQRWRPADGKNVNASQVLPGGIFPGCQETASRPVAMISKAEATKLLQEAWVEPVAPAEPKKRTPAPAAPAAANAIGQHEIDDAVRKMREERARTDRKKLLGLDE